VREAAKGLPKGLKGDRVSELADLVERAARVKGSEGEKED
jgi:hypothetical protein